MARWTASCHVVAIGFHTQRRTMTAMPNVAVGLFFISGRGSCSDWLYIRVLAFWSCHGTHLFSESGLLAFYALHILSKNSSSAHRSPESVSVAQEPWITELKKPSCMLVYLPNLTFSSLRTMTTPDSSLYTQCHSLYLANIVLVGKCQVGEKTESYALLTAQQLLCCNPLPSLFNRFPHAIDLSH